MKEKMDLDFIDELPTVFNILKYNPGAIVDDTAIERLLNWLEEACAQKDPRLVKKSLEFLESDDIWNHTLTLSFALRYSGYLGHQSGQTDEKLADVIKNLLQSVVDHKQFSEPTVQYGFYKCLTSLSKDVFWCQFLQDFVGTTLETFKKSYLYVKKAATGYFASYLHTVLLNKSSSVCVIHKMIEPISDPEQLCHIVESISSLSRMDVYLALRYLLSSNLIESLISSMKSNQVKTTSQMVAALQSLFSILTRPEVELDWKYLLREDQVEEFLLDFIRHVKQMIGLEVLVPSLCESLMKVAGNARIFSPGWNYKLLQFALLDLACQNEPLRKSMDQGFLDYCGKIDINVKSWKKLLMITLNDMIKIERKISLDPLCQELLKQWRLYCLKILTVSLQNNLDGQVIDDYLASVMHDKKVPRLCFQYLKEMDFQNFDDELKEEFLSCLWDCLNCHTESPQIVCSSLEIFSKYICQDKENLGQMISYRSPSNGLSVADTLNKLMWDTNWEVKDSLIDVLMKILDNAKAGSETCYKFMEENKFWVKVIDLIDNQESYIRAKTVSFMGKLVLYKAVWDIFCRQNDYSMLVLWKLLQDTFTSEQRQDDIFTRRSTLQVVKTWVLSQLDYICSLAAYEKKETNDADERKAIPEILLEILRNGSRDFDWEVRKLTFSVWTDIATVSSDKPDHSFLSLFADSNFAYITCSGVCDCEYLVKMEALRCLKYVKSNFLTTNYSIAKDTPSEIENFHCYENLLLAMKGMSKGEFQDFIQRVDLERMGSELDVLDVTVNSDPVSFVQDIIASAKQSEANLLDCY